MKGGKAASSAMKKGASQPQVERFIETARMLGCDESEEQFNRNLRTIAKQKPHPHEPKKKKPK